MPRERAATTASDDECIERLALLIEHQDQNKLHEIVALIARLTAPMQIESY
ncbi:hypothetical protein [Bradyrhizobium sp. NP1]|uniref:hypothetical protein n=1 Tax=Bradyrhizobium sp. NP1 TaxID=3049772 RepID=UPI0025A55BCE|nr:hypothetical protein [Bradyrhizobium sp. NP1]WJR75217.1 hypothetical protein QOU61_20625 [Bradyrhizobium sp. NP1]